MHRTFRISVDGHPYTVVVEEVLDDASHGSMTTMVPALPIAPTIPGISAPPIAVPPPAPAPAAVTPPPAGAGAETAPLAGVVVSIDVAVGQTIAIGQRIAVIEAMKMKTEIFAKHAGQVTSIAAKAGETVDGGETLLTIG